MPTTEHVYDEDDIHRIKNCPACKEYFDSLPESERRQAEWKIYDSATAD